MSRRILLATAALAVLAQFTNAQTAVEDSSEARFQLDLRVPDTVLNSFLPPGWMPNIAPQGAAKDANLRAVFIDRVTINAPDGKPVGKGSNRLVYLIASGREPARTTAKAVQPRA